MLTPYRHAICGGVAFYKVGAPWQPYDLICAADVRLLDGTQPVAHTEARCSTCGRGFFPYMSGLTPEAPIDEIPC